MFKIVIMMLLFINTNFAFAANTDLPSCGIEKSCADGYYCSGAVGESDSGVCVANGINIAMCRFIEYFQSTVVRYLFIFAAVFVGLYLFIGKMNFGILAQILIGMAMLLGAGTLVADVTGGAHGLCGKKEALKCLEDTADVLHGSVSSLKGTRQIRNLTKVDIKMDYMSSHLSSTKCDALECTNVKCDKYTKTVDPATNRTTCSRDAKKDGRETTWIRTAQGTNFTPVKCDNSSFRIQCDPIVGTYERDYFYCKSCVGTIFAAEAPSAWHINNCKELVTKNVKQKKP